MYHAVEAPPTGTAFPELWVPAERFAEEMHALDRAGYHAITMHDATDYWEGRRRVPASRSCSPSTTAFAAMSRTRCQC